MLTQIILDMYRQMIGARNINLIDQYVSDHYIQHSPGLEDGKDGLRKALEQLRQMPPAAEGGGIHCIIEDGDCVALLLKISWGGKETYIADVFRMEDKKVVEHWDVTGNITGMFIATKMHRIIQSGEWIFLHAEGVVDGQPCVCMDVYKRDGVDVIEHIRVLQLIPDRVMHRNGII